MIRLIAFLSLTLCLFIQTATAQVYQRPDDMEYFKQKKAPTSLDPDAGYIFVRLAKSANKFMAAPTLIRTLTAEEHSAYEALKKQKFAKAKAKNEKRRAKRIADKAEAKKQRQPYNKSIPPVLTYDRFVIEYKDVSNVYQVWARKEYRKTDRGREIFFKLTPGNYVVYDLAGVCMCMGTVQFQVKAGEITDMGMIVSDVYDRGGQVSEFPEIEAVSKNHGEYRPGFPYSASAIRPSTTEMGFPEELAGFKRVNADYRAKGKMPMYFSTMLDRLVPMPGVLSYRQDKVIDERTGQTLK